VPICSSRATGTLDITPLTARAINGLAGKTVVSAGAVLGPGTVSPVLK